MLLGYVGDDSKQLDLLADLFDQLQRISGDRAAAYAITAPHQTLPLQERVPVLTDATWPISVRVRSAARYDLAGPAPTDI